MQAARHLEVSVTGAESEAQQVADFAVLNSKRRPCQCVSISAQDLPTAEPWSFCLAVLLKPIS